MNCIKSSLDPCWTGSRYRGSICRGVSGPGCSSLLAQFFAKEVIFGNKRQLSAGICVCEGQWERAAVCPWAAGWFHSWFSAEMLSLCSGKRMSDVSETSAELWAPGGAGVGSTPVSSCEQCRWALPLLSHSSVGCFYDLLQGFSFLKRTNAVGCAFKWMRVLR